MRYCSDRLVEPVDKLVSTQGTVTLARVEHYIDHEYDVPDGYRKPSGMLADIPVVVRVAKRDYILDGHHRLTAEWAQGARSAGVRLVDLDAAKWKLP